jgi:hypothetical protein
VCVCDGERGRESARAQVCVRERERERVRARQGGWVGGRREGGRERDL